MKNTIIKYTALICILGLFASCSDWLEETNPNKTSTDSYWKDLTQTNSTLTAAYSTLLSGPILNTREEAWRSDMAVPGYGRPSYSGDGVVWYSQLYNSSNEYVIKKWEGLYLGIFRANQAILGLKRIEGTVNEADWTQQMAEARFLRGLFHFYLHSAFNKGDIIIKDAVPDGEDSYNTGLSKSEDVIKFFRGDLQYAYDNLPAEYDAKSGNVGRATRGTAATILGTSHLYQATLPGPNNIDNAELEEAIKYFEDVTNKVNVIPGVRYPYTLVRDSLKQFTFEGEMNSESIFEVAYTHAHRTDISSVWTENRLTNRLAGFSSENSSNAFFPSMWITNAYLNEPLDSLNEDNYELIMDETDLTNPVDTVWRSVSHRASAMIALARDEHRLYYNEKVWKSGSFNLLNGASRYRHYSNADRYEDEADSPAGKFGSDKNITINRLGDVYMMLAECYIYKNRIDDAIDLINEVRGRWKLMLIGPDKGDGALYNKVNYDASSLLTRLQQIEKPLETSVEGHCIRWFDLRRWGMLKTNFEARSKEIFWSDHYLPLGETETKWDCSVTDVDPNDPNRTVFTDYEQASLNFNYEDHAWFGIPATELVNNEGIQ